MNALISLRNLVVVASVVGFLIASGCAVDSEPRFSGRPSSSMLTAELDVPPPTVTTPSSPSTTTRADSLTSAPTRPDLAHVEPSVASPGQTVELMFDEGVVRGTDYVFERADGAGWLATYRLISDRAGAEPAVAPIDNILFGGEELIFSDSMRDAVLIPPDAEAGLARICTASIEENFCVEIEVVG